MAANASSMGSSDQLLSGKAPELWDIGGLYIQVPSGTRGKEQYTDFTDFSMFLCHPTFPCYPCTRKTKIESFGGSPANRSGSRSPSPSVPRPAQSLSPRRASQCYR